MKYIKLPQPYATALCYGYFDGVHLDEEPESVIETFAVIATAPVEDTETPIELLMAIRNEQLYGNVPPTEELPINEVIGFISVMKEEPYEPNVWTRCLPVPAYRILLARVFDNPFQSYRFREDLEYSKFLPYHIWMRRECPTCHGSLYLPVNKDVFYTAVAGGSVLVDLTEEVRRLILNDPENENELKTIDDVNLICEHRMKTFEVVRPMEIIYEMDAEGNPVLHPSIDPDKQHMRVSLKIDFSRFIE